MAVRKSLIEHIPSYAPRFPVSVPANKDVSYGSIDGPFIAVDAFGTTDRFYVNHVTGGEIAAAFGWLNPAAAEELTQTVEQLRVRVAELEEELLEERMNKSVPLAEVLDFMAAKAVRETEPAA